MGIFGSKAREQALIRETELLQSLVESLKGVIATCQRSFAETTGRQQSEIERLRRQRTRQDVMSLAPPGASPQPTFDEWFEAKHGGTFEERHMRHAERIDLSMKMLTVYMREYVTDVARWPA